jgi:hypothetical protein
MLGQRYRLLRVESETCALENGKVAEMLAGIHREIAAVRKEFGELTSAKETAEKMLAGGLFEFTRRVDAVSFKVLCAVLAEGTWRKRSASWPWRMGRCGR